MALVGITEIDLTPDTTQILLPDGSVIDGQATFVMGGVTRTAANVALVAEAMGAMVTPVVTGSAATTLVVTSTGKDASGEVLFVVKSETTANGGTVTNSWDMNGDGVFERVQRIVTVVDGGTGARTGTEEEETEASLATKPAAERKKNESTFSNIFTPLLCTGRKCGMAQARRDSVQD